MAKRNSVQIKVDPAFKEVLDNFKSLDPERFNMRTMTRRIANHKQLLGDLLFENEAAYEIQMPTYERSKKRKLLR